MRNKGLLAIFIICFIVSVILSFSSPSDSGICGTEQGQGCGTVQDSKYASTFGVKNSYIGLFVYAFLSIVIFSHIRRPRKRKKLLVDIGVIVGAVTALYFLYLQQFVLEQFCTYCLIVDFGMMVALLLIIPKRRRKVK